MIHFLNLKQNIFGFKNIITNSIKLFFLSIFTSARCVSPSLDELRHFSKHLERRMSRLIMVKNAGILTMQDNGGSDFPQVCLSSYFD